MARRSAAPAMEEVTDLEAEGPAKSTLTLEAGLAFAATAALLVGLVLAFLAMKKYFDTGPLA